MSASDYPGKLDIFRRLANEQDEPLAAFVNRLAAGAVNLEAELGVDPSNPGAAFPTYGNIKEIVEDLFRIEQGVFSVTVPSPTAWSAGVDVDFASSSRFTDHTKTYVHVAYAGGPRISENAQIGTKTIPAGDPGLFYYPERRELVFGDIGGISDWVNLRTSSAAAIGFTYRASIFQNAEEETWQFAYVAIQSP